MALSTLGSVAGYPPDLAARLAAPIYRPRTPAQSLLRRWLQGQRLLVEGNIASGKSTLVAALVRYMREELGLDAMEMPEDMRPKMLAYFFKDAKARAFDVQMTMKVKRKKAQLLAHLECTYHHRTTVEDRSEVGDFAFALMHYHDGNISAEQLDVYLDEGSDEIYRTPMLALWLRVDDAMLKHRVAQRGREGEKQFYLVDRPTYLAELEAVYREIMTPEKLGCPVYEVPWDTAAPDIGNAALERLLLGAMHALEGQPQAGVVN